MYCSASAYNEFMDKYLIKVVLVVFCLFAVNAANAKNTPSLQSDLIPITLQLNWNHQFEFAGFYAAIQQGYYQKAGLDVTIKSWQPGIISVDEVISGRAQFATGYSSIIADYAKGAPIKLVMTSFQFSPMVLLSHEPVLSLQQLAGKRVMHYGNMQIKALIEKANVNNPKRVLEQPSTGNLQDFIDKKTDFYAAYNTNEPYRLRKAGIPFYILDPKAYGIQSYGDLVFTSDKIVNQNPEMVSAFKEATIRGWQYAIDNQSSVVDFIIQNYNVVKDREALLQEAMATKVYVQPGNEQIGQINPVKLLASAVDAKVTGLLSEAEFSEINVDDFLFSDAKKGFTEEELTYLRENPVLQVGNDSYWEPFEYVDEAGKWQGLSADYFALISKHTGIEFKHFKHELWSKVTQLGREKKVPVFSCVVATPERKEFLNFTQPYLSFPLVMATLQEVSFIDDYDQLTGQTVAVPEGYWSHEWLKTRYPNINVLLVDNVKQGLEAVLHGKAVSYLGNLASINFAIKRYGLTGLHIAGSADARFELAIGVEKDNPLLLSIMQKALNKISAQEQAAIYNKWIQLEVLEKTDNATLYSVIVGALLGFLFLTSIIYLFYRQKKHQAFYIHQVNELSMASYTNFSDHKVEWVSESLLAFMNCSRESILGQPHDKIKHPDFSEKSYQELLNKISQGETWTGELRGIGCDGHEYWVEATMTPEIRKGKVIGVWTTRINITDKKRLEEMATTDSLTGVFNRNQFNDLFESNVNKAGRLSSSFSIAMFDVDDFKMVNDRYGHQRGDEVLKAIMKTTKETFSRANDLIFRVGGEEFVVLCDFDNAADFEDFLNSFRAKVKSLSIPNPDSKLGVVTISVGGLYCQTMNPFIKSSQVYSIVDKALYQAKKQGRNGVVIDSASALCGSQNDSA